MKIKRLFLDIETSPNVVYSWRLGSRIALTHDNIVEERKIICACWKWQGNPKVYSEHWTGEEDKPIIVKVCEALALADEVVTHNGENFDLTWLRTRALVYDLDFPAYIPSFDTKKVAARMFHFNSNRLAYLAQFLGVGQKIKVDFELWREVMRGNSKALKTMVRYCARDVVVLEKVFNKLRTMSLPKIHHGVAGYLTKAHCVNCGGLALRQVKMMVTPAGTKKHLMRCSKCQSQFFMNNKTWTTYKALRAEAA
jgi:hypothetical protein